MTQPTWCVLLDANIIIEVHALNVWASIVERVTFIVPATVLAEATHYTSLKTGMRMEIHLEEAVRNGRIREVSATAEQLAALLHHFDTVFIQRMDRGEAEALALLLAGELEDCLFCTSDGPAIRALNLLSMPDRGISLERLLRIFGLERHLPRPYNERFFQEMRERGAQEFVQGIGLRHAEPSPESARGTARRTRRTGKSRKNR